MKILCDAKIVNGRKEGKWMHYSLSYEGIKEAEKCLKYFLEYSENEGGEA